MSSEAQVALLGVACAFALGLAGIAVSVWQTFAVGKRDAAARREERRADGYLQLLELVQRRGQAEQDLVTNIDRSTDIQLGTANFIQVDRHALSDDSQASALVAAFASPDVTTLHLDWRTAVEELHTQAALLGVTASPTDKTSEDQSRELVEVLAPAEIRARARLSARVRDELNS